jgi:hypothetical protein
MKTPVVAQMASEPGLGTMNDAPCTVKPVRHEPVSVALVCQLM